MKTFHAQNIRNESEIDFITVDIALYESPHQFYASAIRELFNGWDSHDEITTYIESSCHKSRTATELRHAVAECLEMTPVPDFIPELGDAFSIFCYRDEWNATEYVWRSGRAYWLMCWGTAA